MTKDQSALDTAWAVVLQVQRSLYDPWWLTADLPAPFGPPVDKRRRRR